MVKHLSVLLLGLMMSSATVASSPKASPEALTGVHELEVIGDFGGQSAQPFLPQKADFRAQLQKLQQERKGRRFMTSNIPVSSPSLSIGRVTDEEARNVPYHMVSRAMFLIGYDPVSRNWLKENRQFLASKNAVGFVVNVQTIPQMNELQSIAGEGITLQPMPGDRFAEHMNIKHYPFYLDRDGVMR
ncbi:integrating conjugative element protein [Marinobacter nauticus]|uniref:integrating conjugative element protein n=1 Tax=Marinobacter nauticus TaxID=2743 RepID=UPI001F22001C|nr:integrating conjugative element protein [Marinobacter nauticus]